jgi:hypothetical protein
MSAPVKGASVISTVFFDARRDFWNNFVDSIDDWVTRYNAALAKLDADGGVTDTNYAATNPAPTRSQYFTK